MGILNWLKKKTPPKPQPNPIDIPPFPRLEWVEYQWVGHVRLPEWAGFQERLGPYTGLSSEEPSDGSASLTVNVEDEEPNPPTPAQIAAFEYLLANGERVRDAVLHKTLSEYHKWEARDFGKIDGAEQLKSMIGLGAVYVLITEEEGLAHIGFEFGCTWDEEHGFGALTHKDRVLSVGDAETAWAEGWMEGLEDE